mmetsp:Transcript_24081/g.23149  ORF Transcript_24081/g.23149 Transcript_24081/m.23149 type:complete len:207 (-) Transcript_24081:534-1154(-)
MNTLSTGASTQVVQKCKIGFHVMIRTQFISRQCHTRIITIKTFVKETNLHQSFGKIAALDYGSKYIGISVSDETKQFTFPYGSICVKQPYKSQDSVIDLHRQLQEFSAKENISFFVVGFPMMLGPSRALTPLAEHIIWCIQGMPPGKRALNFCMWDEAYSTSEARHVIKSASSKRSTIMKHKDSVAASLILKSFLKYNKNDANPYT